jgi:hypothetical protein
LLLHDTGLIPVTFEHEVIAILKGLSLYFSNKVQDFYTEQTI